MTGKCVNRKDLGEAVQRETGLSRPASARIVAEVIEEITACLERGESVKLASFGSLVVRGRGPRMGRDLRTGKDVPIPSRRILVFKPSPILTDKLAKGSERTTKLIEVPLGHFSLRLQPTLYFTNIGGDGFGA